MAEKVSELNRMSARRQAAQMFASIFEDYPAQRVSEEDLKRFVTIRNDITHRGVADVPWSELAYEQELHIQHMRLKSLLERAFLALLGERPNLMEFGWEHWTSAA